MKVICYEEGGDPEDGARYDLTLDAPQDLAIALRAAAREFAELQDDEGISVVVIPADDEARALPGWKSDEDEPHYRMFEVEAVVHWHAREVTA